MERFGCWCSWMEGSELNVNIFGGWGGVIGMLVDNLESKGGICRREFLF